MVVGPLRQNTMSRPDSPASSASVDATAFDATETPPPTDDHLVYDQHVDFGGPSELPVTIVEAIAEVRDADVTELVPRIHRAVDPDALERIFRQHPDGHERDGWVTFFLCGCRITVDSTGRLSIYDGRAGAPRDEQRDRRE